ncbi:YdgA family protein [Variovorax rhizosphaerae]|uniref:DUF945 family protein n=1 Tax=Variovorax rhizosphaerae TaxID=1836200 RepID=A0ABU8WWF0_9BURK
MKALAAIAVVVVGGYLGATAVTGNKIAAAYETRAEKLEKQFPFLHVVDRQTEKGMFSSTYGGKLRIGCAPAAGEADKPGKTLDIGFRDHVRTGPLPGFSTVGAAVIESEVILPDEVPEGVRKYLAGMKPQDIRTVISYGGDYDTKVRLPGGNQDLPQGKLTWSDVHLSATGNLDGGAFTFDGTLPEFVYAGSEKDGKSTLNIKLAKLRWHGTSLPADSVWLRPGTSTVDIERVEVLASAGDKPVFAQIGKFKYLTEVKADKDLLDGKAAITADATLRVGEDAKPIQLDNFEFQESVKHLHGPTLQKAMETSMAQLSSTCDGVKPSEEDAAALGLEMMRTLAQLLPHTPEVSINKLAVTYEGQRGELSFSASAPGLTAEDVKDPMSIQTKLQTHMLMKANAKLPVAWVQLLGERGGDPAGAPQRGAQAHSLVELAVGKGFAVREGDFLTSAAVLEKGALLVNGKPMMGGGK